MEDDNLASPTHHSDPMLYLMSAVAVHWLHTTHAVLLCVLMCSLPQNRKIPWHPGTKSQRAQKIRRAKGPGARASPVPPSRPLGCGGLRLRVVFYL
jgi:hypothetical protein